MTTIVTLALDQVSQQRFDALREEHFPPALNKIPAHLSLFHALPGGAETRQLLVGAARNVKAFSLRMSGVRSMGRGVMFSLESPELMQLHKALAAEFQTFLTPQDKQPLRPHVVVQNKVEPAEAKALLAVLQAGFSPWPVEGQGLDWWEYRGGPWRHLERIAFGAPAPRI